MSLFSNKSRNHKNNSVRAKPFYRPLTLLFRQALSAFFYASLTRWNSFPRWALKAHGTIRIAAGAIGMGCIGFPNHPVWEMTTACNLKCRHCHTSGGSRSPEELTTEEAKKMLREIASINIFRMMVFTGGEPLVRPDIYDLCAYSSSLNLAPVIATNGTLITPQTARRLRDCGVLCLAFSLDGSEAESHNRLRGDRSAFQSTIQGIENWKALGMPLQINITAMKENLDEIPAILKLADKYGASIALMYQLIPVGRGDGIKENSLSVEENKELLEEIYSTQKELGFIVEPVGAPQCFPYLLSKGKRNPVKDYLGQLLFMGCTAGRGLCYIKPDGDVWPCPFLPLKAGNIKEKPLNRIWEESEVFTLLRDRENLKGECGKCYYRESCGGCRGRAYALSNDLLSEDPSCFLNGEQNK